MLRRILLPLAVVAALLLAAGPPASADGEVTCKFVSQPDGTQKEVCTTPGGGGGDHDGGGGQTGTPVGGGGSSECRDGTGALIPCSVGNGWWWNGNCYVTNIRQEPQAPPPAGSAAEDGAWYYCATSEAFNDVSSTVWVGNNAQPRVNPEELARRAVAAMDLDPITVGIVPESGPDRVGLVGLPVWMWAEQPAGNNLGPISRSASDGPVTVSLTAQVATVAWDMGDGTKVTCTGKGTPYADHYGKQDSPTCGHRYAKMSTDQPDGVYQVTATSHWVVEWTGGGQSGTIEFDLTTDPVPIRIGEAQVLTQ